MKINSIILAAGLGTRLRPLTDTIPKPLVPICNKPLLDIIVHNLKEAGVSGFAINTHYLSDVMRSHIKAMPEAGMFTVFHEPEILGTGGPLVNARKVLEGADCFILHNGDIFTNINIPEAVKFHVRSKAVVTMVLIDGPENKVAVSSDSSVLDIMDRLQDTEHEQKRRLTYSGIAIFSDRIFKYLPKSPVNCSIIKAITKAIDTEPGSVKAFMPENVYWNDLGTIGQYFKANEDVLLKKLITPFGIDSSKSMITDESSRIAGSADVSGFLVAGRNCTIEDGASLKNCVLFDGAVVKKGSYRHNEIIAHDFSRHRHFQSLKDLKILKKYKIENYVISSLIEQGSDRGFYRLDSGRNTKVLMRSSEMDEDFMRYVTIGNFLHKSKLPVPEIYDWRTDEFSILMEDLGDTTIYKYVHNAASAADIKKVYMSIVDCLVKYQLTATQELEKNSEMNIRIFDYDYLRWETNYFKNNFLVNYSGIGQGLADSLNREFDDLASAVVEQPRIFMHRDFQSQNILLQKGKIRIVDFQGGRRGPLAYDIMSLVKDPYVKLEPDLQEFLIAYYYKKLKASKACAILRLAEKDIDRYQEFYSVTAGLQRVMQALGAYAFLSIKKGKMAYLQYIPFALPALKGLLEKFNALKPSPHFTLDSLSELSKRLEIK